MKNFRVFTAVCAAAVIALMSASYSMAGNNNSTMSKDTTIMAMKNGTHHGNGSGTHNGTGGNHNDMGTGTCRK